MDLRRVRTDIVGSLLRPAAWKTARGRLERGEITHAAFAAIERDCIAAAVRLQEEIGLDIVSDGEISRLNFQDSFGLSVGGFDAVCETASQHEKRAEGAAPHKRWDLADLADPGTPVTHRRPVTQRIYLRVNVPLEEYRRVAPMAQKPATVSLIGPDRISQRFDYRKSTGIYGGLDDFVDDVVALEREMIGELVEAGCRYIHIDAPGLTAYVDEKSLDAMRARGEDPMRNLDRSLKAEAALVGGFPGVTFAIHLCRGNQRSMWHREGAYDAIAERIFNELPHERFLLEYDSPRAGGFEPLRFMPQDRIAVLGLISTKLPKLETLDDLRRRIDEAAKFVPLDCLAISPQCGFGSDVVGNLLSEDDQRRKLELVVETARRVWS